MSTNIEDSIEREIVVKAPVERVYAALAEPELLAKWFPDAIEGTLEAGSRPVLDFGEYGKMDIYIVAADPYSYFAFRWVSGSRLIPHGFRGDVLAHPNTLVEFRLTQAGEGTRVHLKESGFASLPADIVELNFTDNTSGWEFMMDRLATFLA